jgi:hypothetical protein
MNREIEVLQIRDRLRAGSIHRVWPYIGALVVLFSAISVLRVWSLGSGAFDLGFHVHALGAVARDGIFAPASWAGWTFLQDHFAPWLLPLAPFVASSWGGYVLVVSQAVCYGASVVCVWRVLERASIDHLGRKLLTAAYAFAPALTFPLLFDSHSNVMAVPFIVLLMEALIFDRPRQGLLAAIAAVGFREDVTVLVAALAIVYAKRNSWVWARLGIPVVIATVGWRITTPGRPDTMLEIFYGYLGPYWESQDFAGAISAMIDMLWSDGLVGLLVIAILFPWVVLGRLGTRPLIALGLAGSHYLLADSLLTKTAGFQYWALAPALMVASVVEAGRTQWSKARFRAFGASIVIGILAGPLAFGTLGPGGVTVASVLRNAGRNAPLITPAHRAIACVPDDDLVAVISELTPLTGQFPSVQLLPHPFERAALVHGTEIRELPMVNSAKPDWVVAPSLPLSARPSYDQVEGIPLLWRRNSPTPARLSC